MDSYRNFQESGLYYLQTRYYDPNIGRFVNADAFATTGQGLVGNNMFAYCNNTPVQFKDPTGTYMLYEDALRPGCGMSSNVGANIGGSTGVGGSGSNTGLGGSLGGLLPGLGSFVSLIDAFIHSAKTSAATRAEKTYRHEYEEHHIVAQTSPKALPARIILYEVFPDEGTNVALNKVLLSTNMHKGLHTDFYYGFVNYTISTAYYNAYGNSQLEYTNVSNALAFLNSALAIADMLWR